MNISDQIAELAKKRAAKIAALEELRLRTTTPEVRAFTPEEQSAFDQCSREVDEIDKQTETLRGLEQIIARQATPPGGGEIRVTGGNRNVQKGIRFACYARSILVAGGNAVQALEIARTAYRDMPEVQEILRAQMMGVFKAAAPIAQTDNPAWAGALNAINEVSSEIIELVHERAVIGQMSFRRVPFNVPVPRETAPIAAAGWVGEGKSKPVGSGAWDQVKLSPTKSTLIVVHSDELSRFAIAGTEGLLRDGLVRAIAKHINQTFLSNAAPVVGVSPGGVVNGLPPGQTFASTGNSAAEVHADLTHAVVIMTSNGDDSSPAWVLNPATAAWLGGLQNLQGNLAYPTLANGTLLGYPVKTTSLQPASEILLIDQEQVLLAEDGSVTVDVSREASVQMDTAPATPPAPLVSFWQQNLVGLRGEQFINWMRARDTAVVQITGVTYTDYPPPLPLRQAKTPPATQASAK
jgi:HK97 family phage major capsid protein